ncbi:unnamed protein product, partial [Ectocarpus sp. 12 AP-2014]
MSLCNDRSSFLTGPALWLAPYVFIHCSLTFLTFLFRDLGCNFLNASMTSSGSSFSSSHLEHVTIVWSILGKY